MFNHWYGRAGRIFNTWSLGSDVWTLKRKDQIGVQCNRWYGREGWISTVGHVEMVVEECRLDSETAGTY